MSDSYEMLPHEVTVEDSRCSREVDIRTIHFTNGRIFLAGTIDRKMAMDFMLAMFVLAEEKKDVELIINSNGGEVSAGLLIYDIVRAYKYKLTIYCAGLAASMAAIILAGGQKGRRYILPHSKVMIHEPLISGGVEGSATSIEKTAQSIVETKDVLNKILSCHTGKTVREINEATLYDNYMTADEAVDFGICDEIRNLF